MRDLRQSAMGIAAAWANGRPHHVKVIEDKAAPGPAWRVYVRLDGQPRGRHIATLLGDLA